MQVIISRKANTGIVKQVVFIFVVEMQETEEDKRTIFAVGRRASSHVVYIRVELRQEYVYVFAAVEFWNRIGRLMTKARWCIIEDLNDFLNFYYFYYLISEAMC